MEGEDLVTWKPSPGDSNRPESPDDTQLSNSNTDGLLTRAFAALSGRTNRAGNAGSSFVPRFMRRQVNGRQVTSPFGNSGRQVSFAEDKYWGSLGPLLESKKLSGTSAEFPKVAPPTAPSEHKKMILDQTSKKLIKISA